MEFVDCGKQILFNLITHASELNIQTTQADYSQSAIRKLPISRCIANLQFNSTNRRGDLYL